jgi:hypothetical protein
MEKGARIAFINKDENHTGGMTLRKDKDGLFAGDAGEILEVLFEEVLVNRCRGVEMPTVITSIPEY